MSRQRQGGFLIAKVHRTGGRVFARMLRERGLEINPAQGRILFVLWQEGPMTINEIARRVSLGKSTLTSGIDGLEKRGQVVRVRSKDDRRKILIELTPENEGMKAVYEEVSVEMTRVFYEGFTSAEIARFEQSLRRVLENLEKSESDGAVTPVPPG
ncbi:MAG: MarR family transcriptional regulator [Acidobacteria bacterium]|nr:MAG: MarR family transcriptional regulator [Acidobacteriota bacterium]